MGWRHRQGFSGSRTDGGHRLNPLDPLIVEHLVGHALTEDLGDRGDVTAEATVPSELKWRARMIAKQEGVVCGLHFAVEALRQRGVTAVELACAEGSRIAPKDILMEVEGSARGILSAERVALNFVGRLSGIATLTRRFVDAVAGTRARITDTRKTTPGLRAAEKYAVRCGGAVNHRMGLYDAVLIKDNHVAACGGVAEAVRRAKAGATHLTRIEAEITHLDQLEEAILAGADVVMLDNFSPEQCVEAVKIADGRVILEASGGINLETVRSFAEAGVDVISVGALTHAAASLDVSLDFEGS
jgi:nicotinate-nucleotide pyrophosphorylase (carboxylating)